MSNVTDVLRCWTGSKRVWLRMCPDRADVAAHQGEESNADTAHGSDPGGKLICKLMLSMVNTVLHAPHVTHDSAPLSTRC